MYYFPPQMDQKYYYRSTPLTTAAGAVEPSHIRQQDSTERPDSSMEPYPSAAAVSPVQAGVDMRRISSGATMASAGDSSEPATDLYEDDFAAQAK